MNSATKKGRQREARVYGDTPPKTLRPKPETFSDQVPEADPRSRLGGSFCIIRILTKRATCETQLIAGSFWLISGPKWGSFVYLYYNGPQNPILISKAISKALVLQEPPHKP